MSDPNHPTPDPLHPAHHVHETAPLHDAVDAWHDHSHDETPQHAHGEVQNSKLVLFTGIALALVIFLSCLVVYGFYTHYNTNRMALREHTTAEFLPELADSPAQKTRKEKSADMISLERGGTKQMPTEKEGVNKQVQITPIGQAMNTIVERYTTRKSAQGN